MRKKTTGRDLREKPFIGHLEFVQYIKLFLSKEVPVRALVVLCVPARQCQTLHFVKRPPPPFLPPIRPLLFAGWVLGQISPLSSNSSL